MNDFNIRYATEEEFYSIVREPQLDARITKSRNGKKLKYTKGFYHLISYKDFRLIFSLRGERKGVFEVHIACPKDSIRASRLLLMGALSWVLEKRKEVKVLVTSCPEGKIANMCRKLGFKQVKQEHGKLYFMFFIDKKMLGELS